MRRSLPKIAFESNYKSTINFRLLRWQKSFLVVSFDC